MYSKTIPCLNQTGEGFAIRWGVGSPLGLLPSCPSLLPPLPGKTPKYSKTFPCLLTVDGGLNS